MKEEKEIISFEDGTTKKKETKEYTPKDSFVEDYQPINEIKKKYHKGYQTRTTVTTNDPRIIRWFIRSFCFIFLVIGLVLLLIHQWLWGLIFILLSGFIYKNENQKNNERENEFIKNTHYDIHNKEVVDDFKHELKEETKGVFDKTFSKENGDYFKKIFLLLYSIISFLIVVLLGMFVNWILSFFILCLLVFVGILFVLFINYLFKH